MSKKREKRYVVGFTDRNRVVYGKETDTEEGEESFAYTMTLLQAKKEIKKLCGSKRAIFEIVEVEK
jgi:hypothetical protein